MKIGIDISQLAYERTGVANYLRSLVESMLAVDTENEYILFFSSLRKKFPISNFQSPISRNITIKTFKFPPALLDLLWNKLHILPIEWLIGDVDVFISSDWTQPPTVKAKKATIVYDLIIYKYPEEMASVIVETHKRRLKWVQKECDMVFCISESAKNDAKEILGIEDKRLHVLYPGIVAI
jgi:hypothetical protein